MPSKDSNALAALNLILAQAAAENTISLHSIKSRKSRAKSAPGAKDKATKKRRAANKRARVARKKNRRRR